MMVGGVLDPEKNNNHKNSLLPTTTTLLLRFLLQFYNISNLSYDVMTIYIILSIWP